MVEIPRCFFCGVDARSFKGVIYVRHKVEGRWTNVVCCSDCFQSKRHLK